MAEYYHGAILLSIMSTDGGVPMSLRLRVSGRRPTRDRMGSAYSSGGTPTSSSGGARPSLQCPALRMRRSILPTTRWTLSRVAETGYSAQTSLPGHVEAIHAKRMWRGRVRPGPPAGLRREVGRLWEVRSVSEHGQSGNPAETIPIASNERFVGFNRRGSDPHVVVAPAVFRQPKRA